MKLGTFAPLGTFVFFELHSYYEHDPTAATLSSPLRPLSVSIYNVCSRRSQVSVYKYIRSLQGISGSLFKTSDDLHPVQSLASSKVHRYHSTWRRNLASPKSISVPRPDQPAVSPDLRANHFKLRPCNPELDQAGPEACFWHEYSCEPTSSPQLSSLNS